MHNNLMSKLGKSTKFIQILIISLRTKIFQISSVKVVVDVCYIRLLILALGDPGFIMLEVQIAYGLI
jgi:hypothetical protein